MGRPYEKDIQLALYDMRNNISAFPIMVANVYIWHWECDLAYLTNANYVIEYEVKRSRSDFFAEQKKAGKRWHIENGNGPRQFYFACPGGMVQPEEVPDYAGLIYCDDKQPKTGMYSYWHISDYYAHIVKKAPVRKVKPLTDDRVLSLLRKGASRYWTLQEHLANKERSNA